MLSWNGEAVYQIMALTPDEVELLEDGADDAYGLWEVVWGLRTRYPQRSELTLIAMSQKVIRGLLARGLISLLKAVTLPVGETPFEPVQAHEIEPSLWHTRYWRAPEGPGATEIWFETTAEGTRVVRDHVMRTGGDRPASPD